MKKILLFVAFALIINMCNAQNSESDTSASGSGKKAAAAFSQFSFGGGVGGAAATPKITLNSYRFSALIGKGAWDFYLFNSVPSIQSIEADSEQYVRGDLLRQAGGLLNLSVSKVGYFGYGKDPDVKEVKGAQLDFRMGGKAIDVPNRRKGSSFLVPILVSSVDLRYLIPLVVKAPGKNKGEKFSLKDNMVGNLSFRFLGSIMQVMDPTIYNTYYRTYKQVPASPTILVGTFEMYFYISDQIYINAGYTISNQPLIPAMPFFSLSYGSKK
jgi:hypothetical protein